MPRCARSCRCACAVPGTVRVVTSTRPDQFRVEMPDGLVIERLPVGLAHGLWRVAFIASGADFIVDEPPLADFLDSEPPRGLGFPSDRVTLDGVGAALLESGGSGVAEGSGDEREIRFTYLDNGLTGLRITYTYEGTVLASEVVDLSD